MQGQAAALWGLLHVGPGSRTMGAVACRARQLHYGGCCMQGQAAALWGLLQAGHGRAVRTCNERAEFDLQPAQAQLCQL